MFAGRRGDTFWTIQVHKYSNIYCLTMRYEHGYEPVSPQQSPVRRRLAAGGLAPRRGAPMTVGSPHSGLYG